ncbi:sensor histidine kinase [Paludibacterium paludis]|uniref:histidine kinase n=1 Tax=Paludibacterium paludis TaxID=1225769 RepID=A0A918P2Z5_9NEIS|nr:histidine kinase [Paludibacterium paludis]GGY13332.1 hypothetical protein GCM10011289_15780 [Paludibacterium paludis]
MLHGNTGGRGWNAFRDVGAALRELGWELADWLARVSWPRLLLATLGLMIIGGIMNIPELVLLASLLLMVVKILAGGKREAELDASASRRRADVATLERRLAEARIEALQAQIEPHFLFNTLSSISQLIESDPSRAASMQRNLIDYLRSALPHMRESRESTLGSQMTLSRAYLDIMKERMGERLSVRCEMDDALADAAFPPMMLQTLVENAIRHGLEPKEEGGCIVLGAALFRDRLDVSVRDDGVGFSPSAGRGVGLANIRDRLELLYGTRARLTIEMQEDTGGTRVTISLPYRKSAVVEPPVGSVAA